MSFSLDFTEKEYSFIEDNFGFRKEQVDIFSEDELLDLQDKCSDIEVDAIQKAGDGNLSEDGETASEIVTKIGYALCGDDDE